MNATQEGGEDTGIVDDQADDFGGEDQFDTLASDDEAIGDDVTTDEEPGANEAGEESADEDVEVTLDGGDKVSLKELKDGYFRAKDYTFKTTEIAQEREAVKSSRAELTERTQVVETVLQNLSGYLESLIPAEPALSLARSNPGEYQYQIAVRQNAIAELGRLISMKGAVDEAKASFSQADLRDFQARETAALIKTMPALADPAKKTAFDGRVKAAAKEFGFSDDEIGQTHDHRILRLVHYAAIGRKAEENRLAASRRVETPKQAKAKSAAAPVNVNNRKAMHQLSKTGSIKDAMQVDF